MSSVGTLHGQLTGGFAIEGELVTVRYDSQYLAEPAEFAPIRFVIERDADGRIRLREDRDPDEEGPRCYSGPSGTVCQDPVILYRVEYLPAPAPS